MKLNQNSPLLSTELPRFVHDLLGSCPCAGGGVHAWLFRCARVLHAYRTKDEILNVLSAATANCGRNITRKEIADAIANSESCAWEPGRAPTMTQLAAAKWPSVNDEQRAAIVRDGPALADLWELSPIRFEDNESHCEELIDQLFPGNPLLCIGQSKSEFNTRPREEWRGELAGKQLIVPSPMSAKTGLTQDGRVSEHTLASTGPRKYLIVEFDQGTFDEHAALLCHLGTKGPLALAVHSGKKSLHGWFVCGEQSEGKLYRFARYAVSLGADPATWTKSQFVRMPEGIRDNGNPQRVFFFNPEVLR